MQEIESKELKLKQPVLNIGLVGHIDHGKTTLLHQLSGKWADTHSEELRRGITIKLGYADVVIRKCELCKEPSCYTRNERCKAGHETKPVSYVSFIDVPGHEMLMATMLSGAAIIDAALLVIAANEHCPQPQTKEHLIALQVKGVKNIIIAQNKVDLVNKEEAIKNYTEIKAFVKGTAAENSPIIPCSAQQGINIDAVFEEIIKLHVPQRDTKSNPLFFVARSFDINKPGTLAKDIVGGVLGGILKKGILKVGDKIEVKPGAVVEKHNVTNYVPLKVNIVVLQAGKNKLQEALPSGSLAIQTQLDPRLTKADSLAGCVIGLEGHLPDISSKVKIKTQLFKEIIGAAKKVDVEPLRVNEQLLLSINTTITLGVITRIKNEEVELNLRIPVVLISGSKVGIARNVQGHWRLIGWGEII